MRRVVVTGLGVVSAVGIGKAAFCAALRKGQSGNVPISRFDSKDYSFHRAHEIRNFPFSATKAVDRFLEYARAAADEAVLDSKFNLKDMDPFRFAIAASSSKGGMETLTDLLSARGERYFASRAANTFRNIFCDQIASDLACRFGARGSAKSWIGACATGNLAVADAFYLLSGGYADCVLAGASDASILPMLLAGYQNMKVLSTDRMRPFDRARDGFLVGEGSGMLFLETLESAQARNARIYAEIAAVGLGQETSSALFFNDDEATLSHTMNLALKRGKMMPADIDYVNLHGTATRHGDLYETSEIKKTFGAHAYALSTSTIKPMTGHMLGASGAVEIVATLLAMENKFVPPTIGLQDVDPGCDLNYTAGIAVKKEIRAAMSIAMGFGGQTASILLRKVA